MIALGLLALAALVGLFVVGGWLAVLGALLGTALVNAVAWIAMRL